MHLMNFIIVVVYEIIRINVIVIIVHGADFIKKDCQRTRRFRNPLKASFFPVSRKFGDTFVKIPVGF
jgi:hypothetical protein